MIPDPRSVLAAGCLVALGLGVVIPPAAAAPGTPLGAERPFASILARWTDPATGAKRIPSRTIDTGLGVVLLEDERVLGDPARLAARLRVHLRTARTSADGRVLVDIIVDGDAAGVMPQLASLGGRGVTARGRIASAWLTARQVQQATLLPAIRLLRPAYVRTWSGLVDSQGDLALRAVNLRAASGITGAGVVVGTLSDSFDCLGGAAADVASGDLPTGIQILADGENIPGGCAGLTDEGRGMMQIVHDLAPGVGQAFHTAFGGTAGFANGIRDLFLLGDARVIVDDVIYLAEPIFQDGPIAQAADEVVAMGATYFSSAGNAASNSYEATFRDSGVRAIPGSVGRHDFDPGPGVATLQPVTIPVGGNVTIVLQWDEPHFSVSGPPGSASDIDVRLYNTAGTVAVAGAIADNRWGDPVEIFEYTNPGPATGFNIAIDLDRGPAPGRIKYVWFGSLTPQAFGTASSTIYGHANAAGARAVGAVDYRAAPAFGGLPFVPQSFSSRGGTPILFDLSGERLALTRPKPELMAVDVVDTTFFGFGDIDGNGFPNFAGTSAAAPHAAAVAALLRSARPGATPAQVYTAMLDGAIDMGPVGFDQLSGLGLVQADRSLDALAGQDTATVIGFATGADGAPLVESFASSEFAALGVSIAASGRADGRVEVTAGPATPAVSGFSGPAARASGSSDAAAVTLDFTPPVEAVSFAFASPSGTVDVELLGADLIRLARGEFTGNEAVDFSGVMLLAGRAELVAAQPIRSVIVRNVGSDRGLRVDALRFGTLAVTPPEEFDVPVPTWALALLATLLAGAGRLGLSGRGLPV